MSLYAAGKVGGSREPNPSAADEILSFPGFKNRKKRKKGGGDEAEETTVVPVCACPNHTAFPSSRLLSSAPKTLERCLRTCGFCAPPRPSRCLPRLPRALYVRIVGDASISGGFAAV